jgi:hypothetical protein
VIKYTVDDVVIARSQAKTLLARAKAKREEAKTAPPAEPHPRYPRREPPVMKFNPKAKPYLLKSAKRSETMAAKLEKKADRIEQILKERAQIERGVA